MWAKQQHDRNWSIRRIAVVSCLAASATYAAFSLWQAENRLYEVGIECRKLDPEAIKLAVAELYVRSLPGGHVSMENADGKYSSYPLYPLTLQEYLAKYPDCCRYYPGELFDQKLPRLRQLEGICGSVDVIAPGEYIKDVHVIEGVSAGLTWLVDTDMKLSRAKN